MRAEYAGALLLLSACSCGGEGGEGVPPVPGPAPGQTNGGGRPAPEVIEGFRGISTVEFTREPDKPHTLDFSYVMPDLARWELRLDDATNRTLLYRFRGRFFRVEDFVRESTEVLGSQREVVALQMELRRAAFLWPDGFAWVPSEDSSDVRTADVTLPEGESEPLTLAGTLEASLDAQGRPAEIRARTPEGLTLMRLDVESWSERGGRSWPARISIHEGGERTWTETLSKLEPRLRVKDGYFLPPDREDLAGS